MQNHKTGVVFINMSNFDQWLQKWDVNTLDLNIMCLLYVKFKKN